MKNKRGFELAINTVVILVLAILVLLFLVLFFTSSSSDFTTKIKSYFSYSNIDNIIDRCNMLSDVSREYEFCCEKRTVRYYENSEKIEKEFTCKELPKKITDIKKLSCDNVAC